MSLLENGEYRYIKVINIIPSPPLNQTGLADFVVRALLGCTCVCSYVFLIVS